MKKPITSGLWSRTSGGAALTTIERSTLGSSMRQTAHSASAGPAASNAA